MKGVLPRLLNRIGLLKNNIFIRKIILHNKTWKIPLVNTIGLEYVRGKNTESWIYNLMHKINSIWKIESFIDIGVNTGQTFIKVKSINMQINYIGFEPNYNCLFYVDYIKELNNIPKTTLVNIGLSNEHNLNILSGYGKLDSRATLLTNSVPNEKTVLKNYVPVFKLDEVFGFFNVKGNTIIKIDVEGFELEVVLGSVRTIKDYHPLLFFEVLPNQNDSDIIKRQNTLFKKINELGYSIFNINNSSSSLNLIEKRFENNTDFTKTDYLAINSDNQELFQDLI